MFINYTILIPSKRTVSKFIKIADTKIISISFVNTFKLYDVDTIMKK